VCGFLLVTVEVDKILGSRKFKWKWKWMRRLLGLHARRRDANGLLRCGQPRGGV
jgi:hypothetical protein